MFYDRQIHWKDLEVGKQYNYEEKYEIQLVVTVMERVPDNQSYRYKLHVDEVVNGMSKHCYNVGDVIEVGRTSDPEYYDCYLVTGNKFKPVDVGFDYWFGPFTGEAVDKLL